jgi:DNA-binding LacI/PurR family transcriptional regulator
MLCRGLRREKMFPLTADISELAVADKERVVQLAATGGAPFFIAYVNSYFPARALTAPVFRNKILIGILDWQTDLPIKNAHRVIIDHARGGRLAASHLAGRGHRHVLISATETMLADIDRPSSASGVAGRVFAEQWRRAGGAISTICAHVPTSGNPNVDSDALRAIFRRPNPPTAVFGPMDAAVWACRQAMSENMKAAMDRAEFLGYGNTPWSHSATPPFSTVDWNLEAMVHETLQIIRRIRAGKKTEPSFLRIPPKLVLR